MTDKEKRMAGVMAYNESVKQKKAEDVKKAIDKLKKKVNLLWLTYVGKQMLAEHILLNILR